MIHIVGHTALDHLFQVPSLPEKHQSTFILDHKTYYGGGAANIAAGIANLGGEATLLSAVGGDFHGSRYEKWLTDLGVALDLFVEEDSPTATAYIVTDEAGDQVTYFEWGASAAFAEREAPELNFVHMATADPDFNVRVARKSVFASFDPGQDLLRYSKEQLEEICDHIDILFANRHEVAGMCGLLGISQEGLIGRIPVCIFTMDTGGSMLFAGGEEEYIPAVPAEAADPTGAGDAYRAGFFAAYEQRYELPACCRVGAVAASFAVEKVGCQTNLPDWQQMTARYKKAFGEDEIA